MDKDSLKHHLKIMANDIIGLEQGLKRLDWLEFEILQIKTHFNQRIKSIRNSICTLLSGISAYGDFEDFFTDFAYASPTSTSYIGNGFQEIVSTAPTVPTVKSVEEIIREVQEMIIELKIKGSVREHRDGLIKFTSTVFGCVYGRTKEEIEKKLQEKIKKFKKKPQKDKKAKIVIPLLSEFYRTEYLPYKIRQGRSESTIYSYESEIKFIIKSKFDKPLHLYKPKQIEDFLYSFPEPRKRQMIQGLLNNIFNRAVTLSLIQTNPCAPIDRAIHSQKQGMAYSFDEILEFLQTLFNHKHLSLRGNMNKILNEFLNSHSFTNDPKTGFYGKLNGFQISGSVNQMTGSTCTVNVHLNEDAAEKVAAWVEENKKKYGILNPVYTTNSVSCMINPPFGPVKKYIAFMEDITAFLKDVTATDCCPFCGETLEGSEDIRLVGTYGRMFHAHEHCFDEYTEQVKSGEIKEAQAPNNTLRGLLGAILGSLAGCIIWALMFLFTDYFVVIVAFLISMGAAFMWGKFGGKNNKTKIAVVWAVSIIMMLLTMLASYLIFVAVSVDGNVFENFIYNLQVTPSFRSLVIVDTLISFVFIIVANVYMTINVLKTQKLESQTLIKY